MSARGILIFAAGLGTRMGALTADRPKPLIPVAGRALIDHALNLTEGLDLVRVVNTHYRADMILAHLQGRSIAFSHEEALLETGGGLRQALPLLPAGPVFTLNSDAVWSGPNPLAMLAQGWRDGMEGLLLMVPRDRAVGHPGRGDFLPDTGGRIARGPGLVYVGAQIIRPGALHDIPETAFSLNRVWDGMIARGTLYGLTYPGQWCDVGQPASIPLAEAMLEGTHVP